MSLSHQEAKALLAQRYVATPGTILDRDVGGHDTVYTGGFFAAWETDRVRALAFHRMGDRDSYAGQYIAMAIDHRTLSAAEVDAASLDLLVAWASLPEGERNDTMWWGCLEDIVAVAARWRGRPGSRLPNAAPWIAQHLDLLRSYSHLGEAGRESFHEMLAPFEPVAA